MRFIHITKAEGEGQHPSLYTNHHTYRLALMYLKSHIHANTLHITCHVHRCKNISFQAINPLYYYVWGKVSAGKSLGKTLPAFAERITSEWPYRHASVQQVYFPLNEFHLCGESQGRWKLEKESVCARVCQSETLKFGTFSCSSDEAKLRGKGCSPVSYKMTQKYP